MAGPKCITRQSLQNVSFYPPIASLVVRRFYYNGLFWPCKDDVCPHYFPSTPAKYVIEVNAGYVAENKISTDVGILNMIDSV